MPAQASVDTRVGLVRRRGLTYQDVDIFFYLAALIQFGKIWYWPVDSEMSAAVDKPLGQVMHVVVLLVILYAFFTNKVIWGKIINNKFLLAAVSICCASIMWSVTRQATAFGALDILSIFIATINVTSRGDPKRYVTATFYLALAVLLMTAILASLGFKPFLMQGIHLGRWRGPFPHKNNFGEFISFTALFLLTFRKYVRVSNLQFLLYMGLCALCLAFAQSSTSVFIFSTGVFIYFAMNYSFFPKKTRPVITLIIGLSAIVAAFFLINSDIGQETAKLLGRDITFSGRLRIWTFYFQQAMLHPWLGRGYLSLFNDDELLNAARTTLWYSVRSPHNGYIATILGVGFIGMGIYVLWILNYLYRVIKNYSSEVATGAVIFVLLYCVFSFFEVSSGLLPCTGLFYLMTIFVQSRFKESISQSVAPASYAVAPVVPEMVKPVVNEDEPDRNTASVSSGDPTLERNLEKPGGV